MGAGACGVGVCHVEAVFGVTGSDLSYALCPGSQNERRQAVVCDNRERERKTVDGEYRISE